MFHRCIILTIEQNLCDFSGKLAVGDFAMGKCVYEDSFFAWVNGAIRLPGRQAMRELPPLVPASCIRRGRRCRVSSSLARFLDKFAAIKVYGRTAHVLVAGKVEFITDPAKRAIEQEFAQAFLLSRQPLVLRKRNNYRRRRAVFGDDLRLALCRIGNKLAEFIFSFETRKKASLNFNEAFDFKNPVATARGSDKSYHPVTEAVPP